MELDETLNQEEILWFQKSRRAWVQDGDRNTSFYHRSTIIRRNRSRIKALKIDGEWVSNPRVLSDHISNFFKCLFARVQPVDLEFTTRVEGNMLNGVQATRLTRMASLEEVKRAVSGMKRFGSPGPDGIQAAFYQHFWEEVGPKLTGFVNNALTFSRVPTGMLEAFITLIPKKDCPEDASDFRPITLLNVAFKVVSKVLVNRLRPIMNKLIGPFQNSFLPGRSTLDNVILAQEIMHSMNMKKGKKGFMMVKIDLHKAYDSLNWDFLESVLVRVGFPERITNLIMFSLRETRISILWNGEKLPPIGVGRGLRQGDPLAPYLFILAMEILSWEILEEVERGTWRPFRVARGGTEVSHLFFADDLMIFGEASEYQAENMMRCLESFSTRSGLKINLSKSTLFCSPNTCSRVKRRIGEITGITVKDTLGNYLGIPILQKRVSKHTFGYILDKMKRKLAGWKTNSLSLAGRRILVQSTLATIPSYTMQALALPRGTCEDIDRICRNFLWGESHDKRKIHLVNWDDVCQPRGSGGLGLRKARDVNDAFLAKLAWNMETQPGKLWVKVMNSKYVKNRNFLNIPVARNASWVWRSVTRGREAIRDNASWTVGNGRAINFWSDQWINTERSSLGHSLGIPEDIATIKVSDFILPNNAWDFVKLQEVLPRDKVDAIRAIPLPLKDGAEDRISWTKGDAGRFTTKSAYVAISGVSDDEGSWHWIWKLKCWEKVKSFIWLVAKNSLLTNVERERRHLTVDASCSLCWTEAETSRHLFWDCQAACNV